MCYRLTYHLSRDVYDIGSSVSHSCSNNNSASTSAVVHGTQATSGGGDSTTLGSGLVSPLHATTTMHDDKGEHINDEFILAPCTE